MLKFIEAYVLKVNPSNIAQVYMFSKQYVGVNVTLPNNERNYSTWINVNIVIINMNIYDMRLSLESQAWLG